LSDTTAHRSDNDDDDSDDITRKVDPSTESCSSGGEKKCVLGEIVPGKPAEKTRISSDEKAKEKKKKKKIKKEKLTGEMWSEGQSKGSKKQEGPERKKKKKHSKSDTDGKSKTFTGESLEELGSALKGSKKQEDGEKKKKRKGSDVDLEGSLKPKKLKMKKFQSQMRDSEVTYSPTKVSL